MVKDNMSKNIRKAIDEFKEENGNERFSQKDLLMYLVNRVDNLPCNKHMGVIYEMKNDVEVNKEHFKTWRWLAGILFSVIIILIGWVKLS